MQVRVTLRTKNIPRRARVQAYCEECLADGLQRHEDRVRTAHAWVEARPRSGGDAWRATLTVQMEHGAVYIVHGEGEQAAWAVSHAAQAARRCVQEHKQRARARARRRHAA